MRTNKQDNKPVAVLHGELSLEPIAKAPKGKTQLVDSYIAAHSETGHHHVLIAPKGSKIKVIEKDNRRFAVIEQVSKLWHEKSSDIHETVEIVPGVYELREKTEYSPWDKIVRRVHD